jgi:hypothetical protein
MIKGVSEKYEGFFFRAKGPLARQPAQRAAFICSDPTKENIPRGSSTEQQRGQPARPDARPPEIFSKHALSGVRSPARHLHGLKLNRAGISLSDAIGMMIFNGIVTAEVAPVSGASLREERVDMAGIQ